MKEYNRREFLGLATAGLALAGCGENDLEKRVEQDFSNTEVMDSIAESYVKLVLKTGQYDPNYVDAYFGPEEWKPEAKVPLDELAPIAQDLIQQLSQVNRTGFDEIDQKRHAFLYAQLSSVKSKIDLLSGQKMFFDEECLALFGVKAEQLDDSYFKGIIEEVDKILPWQGYIGKRVDKFKSAFLIPTDKLETVFTTTLAEARKRTLEYIQLPQAESVKLEFVNDKSWMASSHFLGNSKSLIQINTDYPIDMHWAIDLSCHEAYPGHHTHSTLLEDRLMKDKKWVEFSIIPLYSPFLVIAEGVAVYAIDLAFPMKERIAFGKEIATLAGLDSAKVEQSFEVFGYLNKLWPAVSAKVARQYLDGSINKDEAIEQFSENALVSTEEAALWVRYMENYRSYLMTYHTGRELVNNYINREVGTEKGPEKKWDLFYKILSAPQTPSSLK